MEQPKSAAVLRLSTDLLADITSRISCHDIGYLWFCGDKKLCSALANGGVKRFVLDRGLRRMRFPWPWMVANFRQLAIFHYIGKGNTDNVLSFTLQQITERELATLAPTLREMKIEGTAELKAYAANFLFNKLRNLQYITLPCSLRIMPARVHELTMLAEAVLTSTQTVLNEHMTKLPKTVTKLNLEQMAFDAGPLVIPENVTDLTIRPNMQFSFDMASALTCVLPSHLTSFVYTAFGKWAYKGRYLWQTLPRTLTKLYTRVVAKDFKEDGAVMLLSLPAGLTHLTLIPIADHNVYFCPELLRALPQGLTHLDFGWLRLHKEVLIPPDDKKPVCLFPESLTHISTLHELEPWMEIMERLPKSLTSLRLRRFADESMQVRLPNHWERLSLLNEDCHPSSLPQNVRRLKFDRFTPYSNHYIDVTWPPRLERLRYEAGSLAHINLLDEVPLTSLKLDFFPTREGPHEDVWCVHLPLTLELLSVKSYLSERWFSALPNFKKLRTLHIFLTSPPSHFEMNNATESAWPYVPHSVEDFIFEDVSLDAHLNPNELVALRHHSRLAYIFIGAPSLTPVSSSWTTLSHFPAGLARLVLHKGSAEDDEAVKNAALIGFDIRFRATRDPRAR